MKISETILCLDVSLVSTGYAVWSKTRQRFVDWGCFQTQPYYKEDNTYVNEDNARRYRELAWSLRNTVKNYSPSHVIAEMPVGGARSQKAAVGMAASSAVVVSSIHLLGLPLFILQPSWTKRLVSKRGAVSKRAIQRLIEASFNLTLPAGKKAEHIADAMATVLVARKRLKDIV